jgi:iron(III) transport system ATP-binding protein
VSTISCRAVSKSFGDLRALDGLDFDVPDGAVLTVLGESGSGKTTLLRIVAGFERPDTGTVSIDGEVVDSHRRFVPPDKRRIGFVAQEGNLFPHLTVARNIGFGLSRRERESGRVDEMLQLVELGDLGKRYPHQLSGGQQQRVALARALAPRPRLVLLDEPFSSLDAGLRASLRADVMRILRDQEATTVFVTHDQSEALSVADLVGVIDGGRIRQLAGPETLYEHPSDPAVAQFLGEANLVIGTGSGRFVRTEFGELSLEAGARALTGSVVVLVRPEQITLRRLMQVQSDPSQPTGRVVDREYYGHDSVVLVALARGNRTVRVRCPGRSPVEVGDTVAVAVGGDVVAWPARDTSSR